MDLAMRINASEKFSCFTFSTFSLKTEVPPEFQLGEGTLVSRTLPVAVEGYWQEWLGSLKTEEIGRSNFLLLATLPSRNPQVLDGENQQLTQMLYYLLYALLLQGVPHYDQGFSLSGANVDGEIQIRQFSELADYERSYEMAPLEVGIEELNRAAFLAGKVRTVNEGGVKWSRLRRGLAALFRGFKEREGGDRLHQFVRALEALVKPHIGKTVAQFVHRLQTVTIASPVTRETLKQIFGIRSQVEHLHSPLDALQGSEEERINIANRRTRQADCLARFAFSHVLESEELLRIFRTDAEIDAFWARRDHERTDLWGQRLDLSGIQ